MRTLATLVLYERRGQPRIGYRAGTTDQIAREDMAEGTHSAWELRCWTPASVRPGHGVRAHELAALICATFRLIDHCLDDDSPSTAVRRFHCAHGEVVSNLPGNQPLHEHLMAWSNQAALNDVFLRARRINPAQLQAIVHQLQQQIVAMVKVTDELFGKSASAS